MRWRQPLGREDHLAHAAEGNYQDDWQAFVDYVMASQITTKSGQIEIKVVFVVIEDLSPR